MSKDLKTKIKKFIDSKKQYSAEISENVDSEFLFNNWDARSACYKTLYRIKQIITDHDFNILTIISGTVSPRYKQIFSVIWAG